MYSKTHTLPVDTRNYYKCLKLSYHNSATRKLTGREEILLKFNNHKSTFTWAFIFCFQYIH